MTNDELAKTVAGRCRKRQSPLRLPSDADWSALESAFNCKFPPLFYELHRLYSLYHFSGDWLPVAPDIDPLNADTPLLTAKLERQTGRVWDESLVPVFALGNGDYVCLRADEGTNSRVLFAGHESDSIYVLKNSIDEFLSDRDWSPSGS